SRAGCTVGRRKPNEREHTVCRVCPGRLGDELSGVRAPRAGDVEATRLKVVADVDTERRGDRGQRERDRQEECRTTIDEVGERREHQTLTSAPGGGARSERISATRADCSRSAKCPSPGTTRPGSSRGLS